MQVSSGLVKYRFDFLKYRFAGLAFSVLLLVTGLVAYVVRGGFSYHIDFTGGAEIRVSFQKPLDIGAMRQALGGDTTSGAEIQELGSDGKSFLITLHMDTLAENLEDSFKALLQQSFPDNPVEISGIEQVGPEVGRDIKWNSFVAVFLSLILLLFYIAVRSQFRYAAGATIALLHDVLMMLVFILLTGEQISVHILAAVLAVLGYSLNDTIVIFSRVRDNLKKMSGLSEYDIINLSINQTLKRTILTSVSTFLSILAIIILGGDTLRGLSMVMGVGVVVGTYSSIYVATAIMYMLKKQPKTTDSASSTL